MNKDNIRENIIEIVYELDRTVGKKEIMKCKNLIDDLGFDSIKMLSLIVEVENKFNIEFEDEDLDMDKLNVFENLICIVESRCESESKREEY